MPRRVLHLGPYQPTLEDALLREVRGVRENDRLQPIVVLVPTAFLRQHLKRRLALELGGHAGVRFLTVSELARDIAERALRSQGLAAIPDAAATVLWRRAAAHLPGDAFFGPIASTHGFPAALRATVRDLKEAGLTPTLLRRRAQGGGSANRLARKLVELADVWARVEEAQRAAGFHDALDLLRTAGELAPAAPALEGAAAFVYGFYDLTRAQRRLVAGFLEGRAVAAAFVPYGPDDADGTFEYAGATVDFFQGPDLALFREDDADPVPSKPLPRIEIIAAPGEGREALEVARAVAGAPGRLHETGVLLRAAASQAPRLDEALEQAGIPRTIELTALRDPAARAFRLLVETRALDLPRRQVIEVLTTLPVRWAALLGSEAAVAPALWDVLSREWGIVSGSAEWLARLAAGIDELERVLARAEREGEEEDARAAAGEAPRSGVHARLARARALRTVIERLAKEMERIPESGRWSEVAGALRVAFETLFDFGVADTDDDRWARVRLALEEIARLDALGSTDEALGRGTLAEVAELVEDALGGARVRSGKLEDEGVLVADLMKARGLPFRTVVVPGMIEGVFPRVARPDPLLSDAERRALNRVFDLPDAAAEDDDGSADEADLGPDGPIPLKGVSVREERLLFRLCLDAAAERVVFTLPRLDPATARDRIPSWLLLRLLEGARGAGAPAMTVEQFAAHPSVRWLTLDPAPASRAVALTRLERDLADLGGVLAPGLDDGARASLAARLVARSPFGRSVVDAESARWGSEHFTAWDGWLVPPPGAPGSWIEALAGIGFRTGRELSATRLETWARCPYQYFLRYGLGLTALEEPERRMTLEPTDRGEILHRVLERFWRGESEAGHLPLEAATLPGALARLDAIALEVLDEFERRGVTGPAVLWRAARNELRTDLREAVRRSITEDAGFVPRAFELAFGSIPDAADGVGPVRLRDGLAFRGRIDRVDVSEDGARGRVIDYKSGVDRLPRRKPKAGDEPGLFAPIFHGGQTLQRPLYVLAARNRFPEVREWEAIYDHCTQRGEFERNRVPVDDGTLDRLGTLVEAIAADADAGRFPFIADLEKQCRWCDFREVCGPGHEVAFDAKADSPELVKIRRRREDYP